MKAKDAIRSIIEFADMNAFTSILDKRATLEELAAGLGETPCNELMYDHLEQIMAQIGYDLEQYQRMVSSHTGIWSSYYEGEESHARALWSTQIPDRVLRKRFDQYERDKTLPGRILDLGCGDGTNTVFMASKGCNVTGVDVAEKAISVAREKVLHFRLKCTFFVGEIFQMADVLRRDVDGPFDFILDRGCLHHIPIHLLPQYRRLVHRLLRSGGQLLLLVHAPTYYPEQAMTRLFLGPLAGAIDYIVFEQMENVFSIQMIVDGFSSAFDIEEISVQRDPEMKRIVHDDVVTLMTKKNQSSD